MGKRFGSKGKGGGMVQLTIVVDNSNHIADSLEEQASQVVTKTVYDLEAVVKNSISQPGRGRVYGGHVASAPGDPPATWIGDLLNGIKAEMVDPLHGYVESTAEHGPHLEYGTVNMAARPYMTPAVMQVEPPFHQALRSLFRV